MSVALSLQFDAKPVLRRMRRLPDRVRKVTAQEINRQWRQSRTLMVRGLSKALGVTQKRLRRRRIILPRGAAAKPRRLIATGLSLVEVMPARYFAKGRRGRGGGFDILLPDGTALIQRRQMTGQPFLVQTGPVQNVFRRATTARLPIVKLDVDTSRPGYRVRRRVLNQLAKQWPAQWQRRMRSELRRVFRA